MAELRATYRGGVSRTLRHGEGSYTFSNAYFSYRGTYRNGKRQGYGSLLFGPDGCDGELTGEWEEGNIVGDVTRTWSDGRTYKGPMVGGEMHGVGTITGNGTEYSGPFAANRKHGAGIERQIDPDSGDALETFTGSWENGKRHGVGHRVRGTEVVDGEWVSGQQQGVASIQTTRVIRSKEGGAPSADGGAVVTLTTAFHGEATDAVPTGRGTLVIESTAVIPAREELTDLAGDDAHLAVDENAAAAPGGPEVEASAPANRAAAASAGSSSAVTEPSADCHADRVTYTGPFQAGSPAEWPTVLAASLASDWQCPPAVKPPGAATTEPAEDAKKKAKKKPSKSKDAVEAPQDPLIPIDSPCGGGWRSTDAPAEVAPAELEEWAAYEDIHAALVEAHKAELAHAKLQASAADRWSACLEPVIATRSGCGVPPIRVRLLFAPRAASDAVEAAAATAARLRASAASLIAEEESSGKKKKSSKKKGKEEPPPIQAPSPLTDGCLPWEREARGTEGLIAEVSFTSHSDGSRLPHGHFDALCMTSRHVLRHDGVTIAGLWMPQSTPCGQLSMHIACRRVADQRQQAALSVCVNVVE